MRDVKCILSGLANQRKCKCVDPQSGRYYTVGDRGAEFVDLKKDSIIFNHRQTEELLKNGHINSRGKAYAEGNAHVTIWPQGSSTTQWDGTGYSSWDDPTYDLSEALDSAADSVGEFEETIDWIAIRMEEHDEKIGLLNAELENANTYIDKNAKIDEIISANNKKLQDLNNAYNYYSNHAEQYLEGMDSVLAYAARNGEIAITEFTKEQDEATVNAINNYREFSKLAAEAYQEMEEIRSQIKDLDRQQFDNILNSVNLKKDIEDAQTQMIQDRVDLIETKGEPVSAEYYTGMVENSNQKLKYLTDARKKLDQDIVDKIANVKGFYGSDNYYEMLADLYAIQGEIDGATKELEEFQNAINDIYWDNFDELINRLDYLRDETESLIDLMSHDDMFVTPEGQTYEGGTVKFWRPEDVEWTEEGIATMGLYAQQMEIAEYKSQQYAEAINDLTAEYNAGHYSESEYLEKLNELKEAQYDSIEAYHEAKDAIVDLNKERIDAIKDGIEKEIDAYSELIEKQKELLDSEKDLYDFEKSIKESEKNISEIRRKLTALENDNSMAAAAERKQLEAELAEAEYELEEKYLDRSYENKQDALDKELEDFKTEKDAEIVKWEEYLENVDLILTESLNLVQANATGVYDTLNEKADTYGIKLNETVLMPWKSAELAIGDYSITFDDTVSANLTQLELLKKAWQAVIAEMSAAAAGYSNDVSSGGYWSSSASDGVGAYEDAPTAPTLETTPTSPETPDSKPNSTPSSAVSKGDTVTVDPSATNFSRDGGNGTKMASFVPGSSYTVYGTSGNEVLIGRDGVYTGWVKKDDLVGHAKGTTGVKDDELAWIDELGEELVLHADGSGRLAYLTKGTSVIPHDISENLMQLGQLDPSDVLARNTPQIGISPSVVNNTIELTMEIGEVVHIDTVTNDTMQNLTKAVEKQLDKYMKNVNNNIRKYTR